MALSWSAATFATGLAWNFASLVVARAFVGLGEDGFSTSGSGWLSLAFKKEKRSIVTGIFGIGEDGASIMPGMFAAAVQNATGVWVEDFPVTPARVLKALGKI